MKITIESTTRIVLANGVECRVWEGATENGIPVQALIPRIAASAEDDLAEFERDLREHKAPSSAVAAFPLSMIL